jgi:hypothetical protein
MALPAHSGPRPLTQFRNHFYTDARTPWTSDRPVARPLLKHRTTQTKNAYTHQTSMLSVGFEPTTPASERAKTVHALDCAATGIGSLTIIRFGIKFEMIILFTFLISPWAGIQPTTMCCYALSSTYSDI